MKTGRENRFRKFIFPVILSLGILLLVSLACSTGGQGLSLPYPRQTNRPKTHHSTATSDPGIHHPHWSTSCPTIPHYSGSSG